MMSLTFGLFTQVSGLGPLGPLVLRLPSVFICPLKTGHMSLPPSVHLFIEMKCILVCLYL